MGFFGRRKIVDLTEGNHIPRKKRIIEDSENISSSQSSQNQGGTVGDFFNTFGSMASSSNSSHEGYAGNFDPETGKPLDSNEKKRRLAKRLKDMTDQIESLSNQVYALQQRIELLEKKTRGNKYE